MSRSLVLLPGLLNDRRLWARQVEALAGRVEVMVGDLTRDDSLSAMAERVLAAAPSAATCRPWSSPRR